MVELNKDKFCAMGPTNTDIAKLQREAEEWRDSMKALGWTREDFIKAFEEMFDND